MSRLRLNWLFGLGPLAHPVSCPMDGVHLTGGSAYRQGSRPAGQVAAGSPEKSARDWGAAAKLIKREFYRNLCDGSALARICAHSQATTVFPPGLKRKLVKITRIERLYSNIVIEHSARWNAPGSDVERPVPSTPSFGGVIISSFCQSPNSAFAVVVLRVNLGKLILQARVVVVIHKF